MSRSTINTFQLFQMPSTHAFVPVHFNGCDQHQELNQ
jgi:hypothetical protein